MNECKARKLEWSGISDSIESKPTLYFAAWQADSGFEVMYDVEMLQNGQWMLSLDALHIADFDTADAAKTFAQHDFTSRVTAQFVCDDRGGEANSPTIGDNAIRESAEDDRFARELKEAQRVAGAHGSMEPFARVLSGRLRQMDKRAKASNAGVGELEKLLNEAREERGVVIPDDAPCVACGKPMSAHLPPNDNCPMYVADGALTYHEQLLLMAELNGWRSRAERSEVALAEPYRAGLERALDLVIDVAVGGGDIPFRWAEDVIRAEIARLAGGMACD